MNASDQYKATQTGIESITSSYFNKKTPENLNQLIAKEINTAIQPPLPSITYSLADGLADAVNTYSAKQAYPTLWDAEKHFDKAFYTRELIQKRRGNIAMFTRDCLSGDKDNRRQVYRKIGDLGLWDMVKGYRPEDSSQKPAVIEQGIQLSPDRIETSLTGKLSEYKETIHPKLYDDITSKIKENSSMIAEKVSAYMPTPSNRLHEIMNKTEGITQYTQAKELFERHVIYDAFKAAEWDAKKAETYLKVDPRTLKTKMQELGLSVKSMKECNITVKETAKDIHSSRKLSEVDRIKQLQKEYMTKWESARKKKNKEKVLLAA